MLSFWFGDVDEAGFSSKETSARWFRKDTAFDEEIVKLFGALHRSLAEGGGEGWLSDARSTLAYVIVLDQFSRNMFRDQPGMFATDAQALTAAKALVASGKDRELTPQERTFIYMPYMHSESLADQDECMRLFRAMADEASGAGKETLELNYDFAVRHRDIVARFGRFPHRNAVLGRESTPEEKAFLEKPGSAF